MRYLGDILVTSPDEQLQLVVEVKAKQATSAEWAAQIREALLTHGRLPKARFFMVAAPDRVYLWKDKADQLAAPPDYTADTSETLGEYLRELRHKTLNAQGLEMLMVAWLSDIIGSSISPEQMPKLKWMFDSGLYNSIRTGSIAVAS